MQRSRTPPTALFLVTALVATSCSSGGGGPGSTSTSGETTPGSASTSTSHPSSGTGSTAGSSSGTASTSGSTGATTASSSHSTSQGASSTTSTTSAGQPDAGGADSGLAPADVAQVAAWLAGTSPGLGMSLNNGTPINSGAFTNIDKYFPVGPTRDRLIDAIVGSCDLFAPPLPNWHFYCEAILASAIVSESTYNPNEVVNDAYATMNGHDDPTVGLLQVRLSSTVHDYNYYGSLTKLASIGCTWPAALTSLATGDASWFTLGGTATYLAFMEDPGCNVPLAAWYYFMNATGNGGANAVYAAQYCAGQGIAGTMVVGLLSHLLGPAFPRPPDATNAYPVGIKYRFVTLVGGTLPSPDPFGVTLAPSVAQYCR